MSKGSNRRPMGISNEEFKRQWDDIFGEKEIKHVPVALPPQIMGSALNDFYPGIELSIEEVSTCFEIGSTELNTVLQRWADTQNTLENDNGNNK